ncbi:hypothetical protein GCM10015536_74190 [Streptomyces griseomycini]|nr:hypothetical protein GCM10015536_74190 [Streptomyces griseomycini]
MANLPTIRSPVFPYHGALVVALQPAEQADLNFTFKVVTSPVAPVMVTLTSSLQVVPLAGRTALVQTSSVPVPTGLPPASLSVYSTVRPYMQYPKRVYCHVPGAVMEQPPESAAAAADGLVLVVTQACTAPARRSREPARVGSQSSTGVVVTGLVCVGAPVESLCSLPEAWWGEAFDVGAFCVVAAPGVAAAVAAGGVTWPSAAAIPVALMLRARRRPGSNRLVRGEVDSRIRWGRGMAQVFSWS